MGTRLLKATWEGQKHWVGHIRLRLMPSGLVSIFIFLSPQPSGEPSLPSSSPLMMPPPVTVGPLIQSSAFTALRGQDLLKYMPQTQLRAPCRRSPWPTALAPSPLLSLSSNSITR